MTSPAEKAMDAVLTETHMTWLLPLMQALGAASGLVDEAVVALPEADIPKILRLVAAAVEGEPAGKEMEHYLAHKQINPTTARLLGVLSHYAMRIVAERSRMERRGR